MNRNILKKSAAALLSFSLSAQILPAVTLSVLAESSNGNQMVSDPEKVYTNELSSSVRKASLNDNWKFILGNPAGAEGATFDDSSWDQVNLPHDYSIDQDYTSSGEAESGYKPGGTGWYRKSFTVDAGMQGKRVVVEFNGVYNDATVYLNGKKLGEHHYGYTGFAFDLTDDLNYEGENVLAVRVDHQLPSSRWYSGSGIYRDVNLFVTQPVHIARYGVQVATPNLETQKNGSVDTVTTTEVQNDSDAAKTVTVRQTVLNAAGESVGTATASKDVAAGSTETVDATVAVSKPDLWDLDNPVLYTLKTEILDGETVIDTMETEFGYRYFKFDKDTGFYLNGVNTKLKGVCMHHDQGALGAAAEDAAIARQVRILKEMGCNSIRVTHNPADEALLEECAKQGILVINEMFDGLVQSKNGNYNDFAKWFSQSIDSSNELVDLQEGDTWAEYAVRSAVKQSRNYASMMMYSVGNEIQEGTSGVGASTATAGKNVVDWILENDAYAIPTIGDNSRGGNSYINQISQYITDKGGVVGYNYVSNKSSYEALRANHPTWTILGSETASHTNSRGIYDRTASNSDAGFGDKLLTSYDFSAVGWGATTSKAWYDVIIDDGTAGEYVWTGFDYLGEPTPWNGTGSGYVGGAEGAPKSSYFGIVDTAGLPKDNYYLYQALWNDNVNTLHVLPTWNTNSLIQPGKTVQVAVYSDAASVELFLTPTGGQRTSVGKKSFVEKTTPAGHTYQMASENSTNSQDLYFIFNVPYQAGKLEAVAYDKNGNVITDTVGRSYVETTGSASKLQTSVDRAEIVNDGHDLAYVTIDITDDQGRIIPDAANKVTVTVSGAGELAGLDNGNQADWQSYRDNNRKALSGSLVAIVRADKSGGEIKVTASAAGLQSSTITINASGAVEDERDGYVAYEYSKNYYVKTGTIPVISPVVKGIKSDGSAEELQVEWPAITADQVANPGTFTISTQADGQTISVTINVIDEIGGLLNYSTAISTGSQPQLPASRPAVLTDGTVLDTSFDIEWEAKAADAYANPGIVTVNGTATVFGVSMPVTASVRVAEGTVSIGENYAPMAAKLTQDIPEDKQSDTLEAVRDESTALSTNNSGGANPSCWSNFDNCFTTPENNTAALTFEYDTQAVFGQFKVYFGKDNYSATWPDAGTTSFEISENGTEWTTVDVTETIGEADGSVKCYTYDFAPVTATFVRVNVTNASGKSASGRNTCTMITEIELYRASSRLEVNNDAAIASMTLAGEAVAQDVLDSRKISTREQAGVELSVTALNNAALTVLPAADGKQVIVAEAEDQSVRAVYTISYGVVSADDDYRDLEIESYTPSSARPGWGNTSVSATDGAAGSAFDNDTRTFWHSDKTTTTNHFMLMDLGETNVVDGIRYLSRQDGSVNGRLHEYKIYAGNDPDNLVEVASGDLEGTTAWTRISFEPVKARYVKIEYVSAGNDTLASGKSNAFASAAELRVTGEEPSELNYTVLDVLCETTPVTLPEGDFKDASAYLELKAASDAMLNGETAITQAQIDKQLKDLHKAYLNLRLIPAADKISELK